MIAHLTGTVLRISEKYLVIETGGIGYKVFAPNDLLSTAREGEHFSVHIYQSVREDALDLYGFPDAETLDFFELLLLVSGIGPKSALGILTVTTLDTLKKAIGTGDTSYLTKVSGIGRKTAEKIVLELRDKLRAHGNMKETPGVLRAESDSIEALKALGYSHSEARDALKSVPSEISDTNSRIREALKFLGKN